jgi:hypothetical protein
MAQFHIHVDAMQIAPAFERFLVSKLGFWRSDFCGHPEGQQQFEPTHHLTQETSDAREFRGLFAQALEWATKGDQLHGYIEGEFIPSDDDIPENPFDPSVPLPFQIKEGVLSSGAFRESEIHVTMDRDASDPRLIARLTEMGLYSGFLPKSYGVAQVMTVQGSRRDVGAIKPAVLQYLQAAGGARRGSMKEERIVDWWVSAPGLVLPPIIQTIEWR